MQYDKTDKTDEMFQELGCLLRHVGENPSASDVAVLVFIYHRRSLHLFNDHHQNGAGDGC